MINKIIAFSIKNKFIVGLLTLALIGVGLYSMKTINLGSVPDITNNQVQVITVSQNLSTEDIEQFVTYPVELAVANLPGVQEIRSVSRFGLSVVTIVFKDDMGTYLPRQLVQEKLNKVKANIPEKFGTPAMGPITTGLGEIYQYTLQVEPGYDSLYSPTRLRTIQDWIVKRQMALVPGVVDVNAFGGYIKQYEIAINPETLNAMNITISDVFEALTQNNVNTGGAYIERNKMANFIRGEGLARSLDDIRNIVITNRDGIPIQIKDVAEKVHFGHQVRYGAFTQDGHEAVGGMVLMLRGENPNAVIQNVKARMKEVQKSLPEGLSIKPFLDRSALIDRTTSTVSQNLMDGALIVVFVLVLLLGSVRGGIITASVIPLSLLFAFILMKMTNVWANLMSLGAIDFGIIVDGAVIIVEGTVHAIEQRVKAGKGQFDRNQMDDIAYDAGSTMMNSAFFGQLIILIVFAPILFLTGVEGKMFRPMAFTFGFAVLGAIILCLTYVPMISALLMKPIQNNRNILGRLERGIEKMSDKLITGINKVYQPVIRGALRFKTAVIIIALILLGAATFTFSRMGGEFIPQLDEGDIAMQALVRPGTALSQTIATSEQIETTLKDNFPEIKTVVARIGVADIPTDPMPMDIADMFIVLDKHQDDWTSAKSKEELIQKIKEKLHRRLTGVNLVFSQPVELRFNELLTGVREDVAVKLYGEDLDVLANKAQQMGDIIRTVPGVGDVTPERISGLPQMTVQYDRKKIAQYGLNIRKLNEYVSSAFAGGVAGVIFEGEKRFDLVIRFDRAHRQSIDDLRTLYIDLPDGTQIPIKEVADISYQPGPMQVSRDNTFRRTYVGVNVRGRDVESVVKDIQKKLDDQLDLPPGYYITYGGEFENLQRAKARLGIVVPIALFLIFILLFFALKSFAQSLMIYLAIPLAAIGGIFFLALRGMPFSISAGVGFIVLFGVAVLNGLVLISRFNALKSEGVTDITQRILIGTQERLRPILLTATAAIMGFTPMAFSMSSGAEVQRPLATVVIGGLVSATLLTLVMVPVLYYLVENWTQGLKLKRTKAKSMTILITGALLGAMGTGPVKAQSRDEEPKAPKIGLNEAVERAMQYYPQLQIAHLKVEKEKSLKKTAWDLGNTVISTGKEEVGNGSDGIYNQVSIQQQGVDIFGVAAKANENKQKVHLAEVAVQLTRYEVAREVKIAWSSAYTARKRYQVYAQLDSLFETIRHAAKVRYETEAAGRLEFLATANRANKVQIEKRKAYQDYQMALQKLNLWLGTDTLWDVAEIPASQLEEPLAISNITPAQHPMLSFAEQQTVVAEAKVKVQKAAFLPKIRGGYSLQRIGGQPGYRAFNIGISIPLFFQPELGRLQSAKIEKKIAQRSFLQAQWELNKDYQTALAAYQKWSESWHYYQQEALPLARKQIKGAVLAYQQGALDYVAFLENLKDAIQMEVQGWEAFQHYLEARFRLTYFLHNTK